MAIQPDIESIIIKDPSHTHFSKAEIRVLIFTVKKLREKTQALEDRLSVVAPPTREQLVAAESKVHVSEYQWPQRDVG